MAAQDTSALLPSVKCDFNFRGLNPGNANHDPAKYVTLKITIRPKKKSSELPIQPDHPVKVIACITVGKSTNLVFKEPERPLKEYDGDQKGEIIISGFRILPFSTNDNWHHVDFRFIPKGHEPSMETMTVKWDPEKVLIWSRSEVASISQDAYNSNQKFLTKMSGIIKNTERIYTHEVMFKHGKDERLQIWMRYLQQNVEEMLVKIEKLGGRTAIRAYTDVPDGKNVKPVRDWIMCAEPIFKPDQKDRPVCLEIGQYLPMIINIDFDRAHPRGTLPEIWVRLVQANNDETMYKYSFGKSDIWFRDTYRKTGIIFLGEKNAVTLIDEDGKLKTGLYYLTIGIQNSGWTEPITRVSNKFTLKALQEIGQGESSI